MNYSEATMICRKNKNNYWYAYVTVPQPLRLILNKKQLLKSLGTTDRRIAKSRLREAEAELYQKLDEANFINHPLVKSATALEEHLIRDYNLMQVPQQNKETGKLEFIPKTLKWKPEDWFDRTKRFLAYDDLLQRLGQSLPTESLIDRVTDPDTGKEVYVEKNWDEYMEDPNKFEGIKRGGKGFKKWMEEERVKREKVNRMKETFVEEFHKVSTEQFAPTKRSRTLASVIDEFLKSTTFKEIERKNPATASEYESKIKLFSKWAGNITLDDITHKLGNDFVDDLISSDSTIVDGGVANSTLVKYMSAIKSVWQYCLDQEIVPEKLWGNIKTKGKGKAPSDRRSMTKDELTKFFSINHNQEDRLFLTCLATTGARFEEFAQAKWKHIKTWEDGTKYIDLKMGEVGFSDGNDLRLKNRKSKRHIPLLKQVVELLPERQDDEQKVFSYTTNSKGKHDALNKRLNRLIRREVTKDKQVVLHSLRHSFKTLFRETSNDYELGEFILGHQGVGNVSSSYGEAHSIPDKKKAMEKMDFGFLNTPRLTDERLIIDTEHVYDPDK